MAIALNGTADGGVAFADTITWGHGISGGSDYLLFVSMCVVMTNGDPDDASAFAEADSVPMTLIDKSCEASGAFVQGLYLFALGSPPTGISVSIVTGLASPASGVFAILGCSAVYANTAGTVLQSTVNDDPSATSLTTGLSPSSNVSWGIYATKNTDGTASAGTGSTLRVSNGQGMSIFDSDANMGTGSMYNMTATTSGAGRWNAVMAEFPEPSAPGGTTFPGYIGKRGWF